MQELAALCVGSLLSSRDFEAKVIGSFDRTCNLKLADGTIITCATSDYFNMPRGIIVQTPKQFKFNTILGAETLAYCRSGILRFSDSDLKINLQSSKIWPPYFKLKVRPSKFLIAELWHAATIKEADEFRPTLIDWAQHAIDLPVQELIGRGPGLTPLGDDILTGILTALVSLGSTRGTVRARILQASALTGDISRQMLSDAIKGHFIEPLVAMMSALYGDQSVKKSIQNLQMVGSSSGMAMLLGLLTGVAFTEHVRLNMRNIGPTEMRFT
jgi:hypothetical protein